MHAITLQWLQYINHYKKSSLLGLVGILLAAAVDVYLVVWLHRQTCTNLRLLYLGVCLGLQLAVVEFARNILQLKGMSLTIEKFEICIHTHMQFSQYIS